MRNNQNINTSQKKGFTLIETVVALGILTIALTAAITLIVNVVNMSMLTRDKTEATALMQKGISDAAAACGGCRSSNLLSTPYTLGGTVTVDRYGNEDPGGKPANKFTLSDGGKTLTVLFYSDFDAINEAAGAGQIDKTQFTMVASIVTWSIRGVNHSTRAIQYVRKEQ